jgi:hypothetical protein
MSFEQLDDDDEAGKLPSPVGRSGLRTEWGCEASGNILLHNRTATPQMILERGPNVQDVARPEIETRMQSCRAHFAHTDQELKLHLGNQKIALTRIAQSNRTRNKSKPLGEDPLAQHLPVEKEFTETWVKKCKDIAGKWIEAEQALHDAKNAVRQ